MPRDRALIIFDWDDTLFPTSWLFDMKIKVEDITSILKYKIYFTELDNALYKLLLTSLSIGKVVIVTNANINWILSSKKILPKTSILIDSHIKIISARDEYHKLFTVDEWKMYVFHNDIFDLVTWANQIISIGDAEYEYNALISLKKYAVNNKKLKTIRLEKIPKFDILIDQIEVITKSLHDVYENKSHLDLKFSTRD